MRSTETREYIYLRAGRIPFWRVALAVAIALAFVAALAVLVSGLFLILLPVIVVGAVAARFLGRRVPPPRVNPRGESNMTAGTYPPPRTDVIEAEYEVIEEKRDERAPPPSGDSARRS
jgi:hypothetical protein